MRCIFGDNDPTLAFPRPAKNIYLKSVLHPLRPTDMTFFKTTTELFDFPATYQYRQNSAEWTDVQGELWRSPGFLKSCCFFSNFQTANRSPVFRGRSGFVTPLEVFKNDQLSATGFLELFAQTRSQSTERVPPAIGGKSADWSTSASVTAAPANPESCVDYLKLVPLNPQT